MTRALRRTYVELVAALTLIATAAGIWTVLRSHEPALLAAAGAWFAATTAIGASKIHVARHPRATDAAWRAIAVLAVVAAGLLGGPAPLAVAVAGGAALVGYQTWYTGQHRPRTGLSIGDVLPDFPLTTIDGAPTTSAVLRSAPHVVLFYRGSWCPFCVTQVRELAAQYRELASRGVRVALISPQPAKDTQQLAARFDVALDFYVDHRGTAAQALDIVQEGGVPLTFTAGTDGDTVVPTAVITDASGRVVWLQHATDHRVRPEPTVFMEVIDRAGVRAR